MLRLVKEYNFIKQRSKRISDDYLSTKTMRLRWKGSLKSGVFKLNYQDTIYSIYCLMRMCDMCLGGS